MVFKMTFVVVSLSRIRNVIDNYTITVFAGYFMQLLIFSIKLSHIPQKT